MTRALVTGATGGLGRALVPMLLAAGLPVRATLRDPAMAAGLPPGVEPVRLDLLAPLPPGLFDGVSTVFHLAALSAPFGNEADFAALNVEATGRLLDAARQARVARFVHVSSPSIYAEPRDRLALTEASPPARRFANAYAATKHEGECLALAADAGGAGGLRTVVLRPRAIVGPNDRVLLPRLLDAIRGRRAVLPAGGRALVELTDARDAAAALFAAGRPGAPAGRAFNISGGSPREVRWILARVAARLGLPLRVAAVPPRLALALAVVVEAAARLRGGGAEPRLTRHAVLALGWSQTFDLSAARAGLGYVPQFSPEEAIDHALAGMTREGA